MEKKTSKNVKPIYRVLLCANNGKDEVVKEITSYVERKIIYYEASGITPCLMTKINALMMFIFRLRSHITRFILTCSLHHARFLLPQNFIQNKE